MVNFTKLKLGQITEIQTGPFGSQLHNEDYVSNGTPIVTVEHLGNKYFTTQNLPLVSEEDKNRLYKYILKENDIVFSRVGSVDRCSIVSINEDGWLFSGRCLRVRPNAKYINPQWLYYYFTQNYFKQYVRNKAVGCTMPSLNTELLSELNISFPDLPTQKKIADVLSCIDDKIALNNKTNTELENMAKTIYDYWFTQFDFPDKNGHPYKTSGGQMVYNETLKREIPAGWEVKNILNCCKVIDCLHSKKPDFFYEDENCYLLQLENLIDLKLIDLTNKYYVSKKDYETWTSKTKVKQGDLVVTNAGRVGGVSRIPNYIETGIGRNMTSIRPVSISEYLLCYFFSSSDCDKQIRQNTDQGAFFQSLNVKGIKKLNLTIPPKAIQDKFDSLVGKIRLQIESNHKENEELTKLRDYLLPLLMNGQIYIKK